MSQKFLLILNTIIASIAIAALIVAAATAQQYSYYTLLRWLIMGVSIYFAFESSKKNKIGLVIFYTTIAIIFNPFKKVWFQKETWHLIDYCVAISFALIAIYDWLQYFRTPKE